MASKQSFQDKVQAELDLINLHIKLASMDASDELEKTKKKLQKGIREIKDFIDSLSENEETVQVQQSATTARTKAEVLESIIQLREERLARQEEELSQEANEAVNEIESQVKEIFENSDLGKLKNVYENEIHNKLFEVSKFFLYQDKYNHARKQDDRAQLEQLVAELQNQKAELETSQQ